MSPWRRWFTFAAALVGLMASEVFAEPVRVELRVTPPKGTGPGAKIYVTGNLASLGPWDPGALQLARDDDGTYSASFTADRGVQVEFKITRGSWATVEKGAGGEEISNRRVTADRDPTPVDVTVSSWAAGTTTTRPSTRTGDIRTHDAFESKILHNRRRLWVYLPPGYDKSDARYPVLYMHDGQNCFDAATSFSGEWEADESAERLIVGKRIRPLIIVAVDNAGADRMHEYTPTRDAKYNAGGRGADYARFVVTEVKPLIDRTYRTLPGRDNTATAGSSLGALISLYLAREYPETFSRIGVLSPALQWDNANLLKELSNNPAPLKDHLVWLDMGTAEGSGMVGLTRELAAAFDKAGLEREKDYRYVEDPDAAHNESAWAKRFPELLGFFFPAR